MRFGHTKGSPHGGRWYIGSLFHAGGMSVTVKLGAMVTLFSLTAEKRSGVAVQRVSRDCHATNAGGNGCSESRLKRAERIVLKILADAG